MATAYIYFGKPINADTSQAVINACRAMMGELDLTGQFKWDKYKLSIASGGGDIIGAMAMFNELNVLPQTIETHNSSAVDSSAILPFMAGARRTASKYSAFLFHQMAWNFSALNVTSTVIADASRWLSTYEEMMAEIIANKTSLKSDAIIQMMRAGTTMRPNEAKNVGLNDDIEEYKIPHDARSWQT